MTHPEMPNPKDADPKAFQRWIDEYPRGALGVDLATALASCVEATQLYNGKSALTLKVTIAPGEGLGGDLAVVAVVDSKPARPKPPKVTFFATPDGGLSRRDPNQLTIDDHQEV